MKPHIALLLARSYAIPIVAWVIAQIIGQLFLLSLPNSVVRLMILVLLLGCPLAIISLWVFRRPSTDDITTHPAAWSVIAAVLLCLVAIVGFGFFARTQSKPLEVPILLWPLLFLLCFPVVLAAVGMWRGRRWGWWVVLFFQCLNLLVFPSGTIIGAVMIVLLLWIRPAYFRIFSSRIQEA